MKVDSVNYNVSNKLGQSHKPPAAPAFKATLSQEVLAKEVKELTPGFIRAMKTINDNMGETMNIFINSLGTGLVAPIFIKWNPLSKTDEDTRTYSAWRQPVSAVLAVITQAGVTIPFNQIIENMANSGDYGIEYNKTLFQEKKYITKRAKNISKYLTKDQMKIYVENQMDLQKKTLANMIANNKIIFASSNGNPIRMGTEDFKQLAIETINLRKQLENSELDKCQNIKLPKKIERAKYYYANQEKATNVITQIKNQIASGSKAPEVRKFVKTLRNQLKKQNENPELIKIFNEILQRRGNNDEQLMTAITKKVDGILYDITKYSQAKNEAALVDLVKAQIQVRIDSINDANNLLDNIIERIKNGETIDKIQKSINKTINTPGHRLEDYSLTKEISTHLKDTIKNNLKGHKQIMGLVVSLLMLPVTCSLLNWVYPRFMDAFFPKLSRKKHPNEIKALIDQANQKAEVKS